MKAFQLLLPWAELWVAGMCESCLTSGVDSASDCLLDAADKLLDRFRDRCGSVEASRYGVPPSEVLALLGAGVLVDVDVIIESGTAAGVSTETLARFLHGTGTKVYSIDRGGYQELIPVAAKRLQPFNVTLIHGDSHLELPRLVLRHPGRSIGIFVDGPKGESALCLCWKAFVLSRDVKFCGIHDVAPYWHYGISELLEAWGRTLLLSYQPRWRSAFAALDTESGHDFGGQHAEAKRQLGYGLGLVAGFGLLPLGVSGDNQMDRLCRE